MVYNGMQRTSAVQKRSSMSSADLEEALKQDENLLSRRYGKLEYTILHLACHNGDIDQARWMIGKNRAHLNARDANGDTPIYVASSQGHTEIVKLLLAQERIDLEKCDHNNANKSPVQIACKNKYSEIVKLLLEKTNASINALLQSGQTLLHIAANNTDADTIQVLLARGAETNIVNDEGDTPLQLLLNQKVIGGDEWFAAMKALLKANIGDTSQQQAICLKILSINNEALPLLIDLLPMGLDSRTKQHNFSQLVASFYKKQDKKQKQSISPKQRAQALIDSLVSVQDTILNDLRVLCDNPMLTSEEGSRLLRSLQELLQAVHSPGVFDQEQTKQLTERFSVSIDVINKVASHTASFVHFEQKRFERDWTQTPEEEATTRYRP